MRFMTLRGTRRAHRAWITWLAALATLVAALAPGLSQAMGRQGSPASSMWVEVCRAGGSAWVAVSDLAPGQTPAKAQVHLFDHCPYCALHIDALPPGPALPALPLPTVTGQAEPTAFLRAPRTLHAWAHAQPRAPPLSA